MGGKMRDWCSFAQGSPPEKVEEGVLKKGMGAMEKVDHRKTFFRQ